MKKIIATSILVLIVVTIGCATKTGSSSTNKKSFVDSETPKSSQPFIVSDSISTQQKNEKWKLVFSDEFNDTKIDTLKWNVENAPKKRVDIMLYSNDDQVQEKEGKAYSKIKDAAQNAIVRDFLKKFKK